MCTIVSLYSWTTSSLSSYIQALFPQIINILGPHHHYHRIFKPSFLRSSIFLDHIITIIVYSSPLSSDDLYSWTTSSLSSYIQALFPQMIYVLGLHHHYHSIFKPSFLRSSIFLDHIITIIVYSSPLSSDDLYSWTTSSLSSYIQALFPQIIYILGPHHHYHRIFKPSFLRSSIFLDHIITIIVYSSPLSSDHQYSWTTSSLSSYIQALFPQIIYILGPHHHYHRIFKPSFLR